MKNMNICDFFKSVLEQDPAPIVLCDLEDRIVYMNPSADRRYAEYGGKALVGKSLLRCHNADGREKIHQVVTWFAASPEHNRVYTFRNDDENKDVYMVALRDEVGQLIGYYEKHEFRTEERGSLYDFR